MLSSKWFACLILPWFFDSVKIDTALSRYQHLRPIATSCFRTEVPDSTTALLLTVGLSSIHHQLSKYQHIIPYPYNDKSTHAGWFSLHPVSTPPSLSLMHSLHLPLTQWLPHNSVMFWPGCFFLHLRTTYLRIDLSRMWSFLSHTVQGQVFWGVCIAQGSINM